MRQVSTPFSEICKFYIIATSCRLKHGISACIYLCCCADSKQPIWLPTYSLFTLRKPRSPLILSGERSFHRVNRLYTEVILALKVTGGCSFCLLQLVLFALGFFQALCRQLSDLWKAQIKLRELIVFRLCSPVKMVGVSLKSMLRTSVSTFLKNNLQSL